MGMAASQARFLGLTARKTNTEYEGQQINQQRTTLSNQSANYYNQLLGMTVPTPPSTADFTKTVYTFSDGALTNSITALIAQADGNYLISYNRTYTDDYAAVSATPTVIFHDKDNNQYTVGSDVLRVAGDTTGYDIDNDPYLSTLTQKQLEALMKEEELYLQKFNEKYDNGQPEEYYVRYQKNTSTGMWVPVFYKKSTVDEYDENNNPTGSIYSEQGSSQSSIPAYTIGTDDITEEIKGVTAKMEQDTTGRYIAITLNPGTKDAVTYSLDATTLTDQDKYDDAMNQYEYDKFLYDQSVQEINAKIEIIQAEDKNLELRLKQLDTEQSAIQTEMDAVSKVIEKNTESTFKTFG